MPPPPLLILSAYALLSLTTFLAFFLDKRAAIHNRRRTLEKTLHLLSLLFGVPGAILAILTLRHKSRKPSFWLITAIITAIIAAIHATAWILSLIYR